MEPSTLLMLRGLTDNELLRKLPHLKRLYRMQKTLRRTYPEKAAV
jgi:hypothetical protein